MKFGTPKRLTATTLRKMMATAAADRLAVARNDTHSSHTAAQHYEKRTAENIARRGQEVHNKLLFGTGTSSSSTSIAIKVVPTSTSISTPSSSSSSSSSSS